MEILFAFIIKFIAITAIFFVLSFLRKFVVSLFQKKGPSLQDIGNVILYTASVTAKDSQNPLINIDGLLYPQLEKFIKKNNNIKILEQKIDSIAFEISIDKVVYKVLAMKFIHNQLLLGAKAI